MDSKELAELVPWLVAEKMEDATSPVPLAGGAAHEGNPVWTFRTDPVLALAAVFPASNELRLTIGLAIDLPGTAELSSYINLLNTKQLVFGRAYIVPGNSADRVAVLMQEIVFGDGLSWDYPPSIQNLLRIMGTLCGQAGRLAGEVADRFEGRPLTDAEAVVLLAYS